MCRCRLDHVPAERQPIDDGSAQPWVGELKLDFPAQKWGQPNLSHRLPQAAGNDMEIATRTWNR
jgi:hypothetical protein